MMKMGSTSVRFTVRAARVASMACAFFLVVSYGLPSHAQQSEQSYGELVREAVREYDAGHWSEAHALFQRAHELQPNARTLRGLGMTAYEARRYVEALQYLEAALEESRKPLTSEQREHVQDLIDKSRAYVSKVKLDLEPSGAVVQLDGSRVSPAEDGTLLVDAGEHQLVVTAPGHQPQVRKLVARPGRTQSLEITLASEASAAGRQKPDQPAPDQAEDGPVQPLAARDAVGVEASGTPAWSELKWTWVALGAAGAFAITAGSLSLVAHNKGDSIEKACPPGACTEEQIDNRIDDANIETLNTLIPIGWGLAGASAIAAGILFYVEGMDTEEEQLSPRVGVGVGPSSVQVRGVF